MKVFPHIAAVLFAVLAPFSQASAQSATTKWQGIVGNQVLTHTLNVGGSTVQIPGISTQSGGVQVSVELHLCKDGSFVRLEKTNTAGQTANVLGLGVQSGAVASTRENTGRWKIASATSANAVIQLTPNADGPLMRANDQKLNMSYNGSVTTVNGERWARAASKVCR